LSLGNIGDLDNLNPTNNQIKPRNTEARLNIKQANTDAKDQSHKSVDKVIIITLQKAKELLKHIKDVTN
jgi:hypothetical protein